MPLGTDALVMMPRSVVFGTDFVQCAGALCIMQPVCNPMGMCCQDAALKLPLEAEALVMMPRQTGLSAVFLQYAAGLNANGIA